MTETEAVDAIKTRTTALWAPPERLNVAQWAEKYRELPKGSTAEPGRWRNSRLPYLTEIMESFTDPTSGGTVMQLAIQMGKTETLLNLIGYVIDIAPAGVLVKYPTLENAKKFSQKKLAPMINSCPRLSAKVNPSRSRDSGNTIFDKLFPGGSVTLIGANSAAGTRAQSCKWILQDEIDVDRPNSEGDPINQADGRAENFHDAGFVKASTPTISGASRIQQYFDESDRRFRFVRCPRCSEEQILKWANVRWTWPKPDGTTESDPERAVYVCDKCQAEWSDFERVRAVMAGRWIALSPGRRIRGFHLSGLYKIMGRKRGFKSYLHEFVEKFLEAKKGGPDRLQFWTNTFLAETWAVELKRLESDVVRLRCETYGPELPKPVLVLTCSVDVQGDRLEAYVKGWGLGFESWAITLKFFMGDPHKPDVWRALDEFLQEEYLHPVAGKVRVACTVIDSGGQSNDQGFAIPVYRFVGPRQPTEFGPGVYAIKGSSQPGASLVSNRRPKKGICLKIVGTSTAKTTVHARLNLSEPGPRFMHYPKGSGFDDEWFAQLAAEGVREVKKKGFTHIEWHKLRNRNEGLDLEAYQLAAIEVLNPDLAAIAEKHRAMSKEPEPPPETGKPVMRHVRPQPQKAFRPMLRRFGGGRRI